MIQAPAGSQIYLAAGKTDMRKGIPGLSALGKRQPKHILKTILEKLP